MPSVVEICNIALTRFGGDTINSLTEASQGARQCNLIFNTVRNAVLREFPWNFASKIVRLALVSDVTVPGWDYAYQYPSDCLHARRVFSEATVNDVKPAAFVVMNTPSGRVVLCNIEYAYLEYTARITDPNIYDPQFIDALAWKLAADLAVPIAGDAKLREHCLGMYQRVIASAWGNNASEGRDEVKQSRSYIEVRR